jgi:hypothetical protein
VPSTRARLRRARLGLGIAVVVGAAAGAPFAMVEIGTRRAAECLERFEEPRAPDRPRCADTMKWFVAPSRLPWVLSARYRAEELGARLPIAAYRDAIIGRPDPEALAIAAEGLLAGERLVAKGSQRTVLWDLGPAVGAPDLGREAAETGDRQTLVHRGEAWLAWPVRVAAVHAAFDEGDVPRAIELGKSYAGWDPRDEDLRATVGALLCLGDEPSRGARMLTTLQDDRAARKYAAMSRDWGDVRELIVACSARAHVPPPARPKDAEAGLGDLVDVRTVLRLRLVAEGGAAAGSATDAIAAAAELLEAAPRPARERVALLAGLVELAADAKQEIAAARLARLATTHLDAGERPLVASPAVTALDLVDEAPGLAPVLPAAMLARSAARLEAASRDAELDDAGAAKLRTAAGAAWLEAARQYAQVGRADDAAAAIDHGGALVLPSGAARALARSSALYAAGDAKRALDELGGALAEPPDAAADPAAARVHAAALVQQGELLASLGRRDEAADAAAAAIAPAGASHDLVLLARARWTALALARPGTGGPMGVKDAFAPIAVVKDAWPWVGFAERSGAWARPEPARAATLDRALDAWRRAVASPAETRLALRYEAMRHRGDAPPFLVPHLALGAALLAGSPGDVELWLDAYAAVDARRVTHRAYAWSRAEAARWRGDAAAAERWAARLRALRAVAADPEREEIARFLGI